MMPTKTFFDACYICGPESHSIKAILIYELSEARGQKLQLMEQTSIAMGIKYIIEFVHLRYKYLKLGIIGNEFVNNLSFLYSYSFAIGPWMMELLV